MEMAVAKVIVTPMAFDDQLEIASEQATIAQVNWDLYWLVWEKTSRARYLQALEEYREFFRFDQDAHFTAFVVGVMRLFDTRSDTISLAGLTQQLNPRNPKIEAELVAIEPIVEKVRHIRHKVKAHTDISASPEDIFKQAGVTFGELGTLATKAMEIVNMIREAHGWEPTPFHELHAENFKALLELILADPRR